MLAAKQQFLPLFEKRGWDAVCPTFTQTLSVDELCEVLPDCDGWIIGDDPATVRVFEAGRRGRLRAAVKWGIGVDNVDFEACHRLNISISNTPGMFGKEVADMALGYVIALARFTHFVDRGVRNEMWPKPAGVSLAGKTVGVIGYGDIGSNLCSRLISCDTNLIIWDPALQHIDPALGALLPWPDGVDACDFLVLTCSLNERNRHMINEDILNTCKPGIRIVNVARGPLINERDLVAALRAGKVHSVALDVFEEEPLPADSAIRQHEYSILGSHNSSNTVEAVAATNLAAIQLLDQFLRGSA
jgi:D-3-phosphoglycerate dehydrogenase